MTNIIRVIKNIGFTTSPYVTTISPKNLWATVEKMSHELPDTYSWASNGFLISFFRKHSFLFSGHNHFYGQNTFSPIVRTHMLMTNYRDFPGITKIHDAGNASYNQQWPWRLKCWFWNDLFPDVQQTIQILSRMSFS